MKRIPWWSPQVGEYEKVLLAEVLDSNFLNEGPKTIEFEKQIAKLLKVKYVLAVNNATSAMFLSLKALGIGHGDEVIVPDITFISTANAVEMTGARAVLVDVDPKTLTLSTHELKKAINKKTKAVIPVHVSGRAADIAKITSIAKAHKLFVVEDAAEALTSKHKGRFLGTFGEMGCFSLSPAKTIMTGQGGLIITSSKKYFEILKMLKDQGRPERGTGGDDLHPGIGFNFKFTDLQAAVGIGQLRYITKRIKRMKKNYMLYKKNLADVPEINIFEVDIKNGELGQWTDATADRRDELLKFLTNQGIDSRPFWHPIHTQPFYKKPDRLFPHATNISPKSFWLPSAFTLTDSEILFVCKTIKNFYAKTKK